MHENEREEAESFDAFIEIGSEITAGLAPIAIGTVIAGPPGAVAGAVASPFTARLFGRLAREFNHRVLGQREQVRVGATLTYAAIKIKENLETGQQVRQDDFFQVKPGARSTAEEVAEGILIAAQRDYQEKKLQFYRTLLANLAFREDIDRDLASALVRQANRMSYSQLCYLAIAKRKEGIPFSENRSFDFGVAGVDAHFLSIGADANLLAQEGLLNVDNNQNYNISFSIYGLSPFGEYVYELMGLQYIDESDVERVSAILEDSYQRQEKEQERRQIEYERQQQEVAPYYRYLHMKPPRIEKYLSPHLQDILKPIVRSLPLSVQFALRKLL